MGLGFRKRASTRDQKGFRVQGLGIRVSEFFGLGKRANGLGFVVLHGM